MGENSPNLVALFIALADFEPFLRPLRWLLCHDVYYGSRPPYYIVQFLSTFSRIASGRSMKGRVIVNYWVNCEYANCCT
jgi:hypothetical protein